MSTGLDIEIASLIHNSLQEDCVCSDYTTLACIDEGTHARAEIACKEPIVPAGLSFLSKIFSGCEVELMTKDGERSSAGDVLAIISGPAREILSRERTALNLLQHLSGIATLVSSFVKEARGFPCEILDTRKTIPGLRLLQKYAVVVGGGVNHRLDLSKLVVIKDNHLNFLKAKGASPIKSAIEKVRTLYPHLKIEVEVENLPDLEEAISCGADRVLLDNMSSALVREAVEAARGRVYLEASGGINLANVRQYAETLVNGISIGALTHSARAVDVHLTLI